MFQDLVPMGQHQALIFLPGVVFGAQSLTVGDIYINSDSTRISVEINAGRLGCPAIEIGIHKRADRNSQAASATFLIEPGQASSSKGNRYHLDKYEAQFLGRPGGAGNMYQQDAPPIRAICEQRGGADFKRRILRLRMNIFGFVPFPNMDAVTHLTNSLPANSTTGHLVNCLLNSGVTGLEARLYCVVAPGSHDAINTTVLVPFMATYIQRITPLHQYNAFSGLTWDMPDHLSFRNSMYYDRVWGTAMLDRSNTRLLPDTRNRSTARPVAITLMVGVIRESQAQDRVCQSTASAGVAMRLVRSRYPILDRAVRLFSQNDYTISSPRDKYAYLGYVGSALATSTVRDCPKPDSVFGIKWSNGEKAFGIVKNVPQTHLRSTDSKFVLLILRLPSALANRANVSVINAQPEHVTLTHFANRSYEQEQLDAMRRFGTSTREESVRELMKISLPQLGPPALQNLDVRGNALIWQNALAEILTQASTGQQLSASENNLLTTVVADMRCRMRLVQSTIASTKFRVILILVLLFKAVSRKVVLVIENPADRAWLCSLLRQTQNAVRNAPTYGKQWSEARILAYTTTDIDTRDTTPDWVKIRSSIDITSKYADELPQFDWYTDTTGAYWNVAADTAAFRGAPLDMSLGDHLQRDLRSVDPQIRRQHYSDRQQVFDNQHAHDGPQNAAILSRYRARVRSTLQNIDILVTDCQTAASEDVRTSIEVPITILLEAQSITQAKAVSVLLANRSQLAAFICGDGNDNRRPMVFASQGQNEAWTSFSKSAWQFMGDVGAPAYMVTRGSS